MEKTKIDLSARAERFITWAAGRRPNSRMEGVAERTGVRFREVWGDDFWGQTRGFVEVALDENHPNLYFLRPDDDPRPGEWRNLYLGECNNCEHLVCSRWPIRDKHQPLCGWCEEGGMQ